ncbi:MAG: M20/M25/M40 family metallo-hydrolase, partial [Rhodothermales bacterium]
MSMDRSFLSPLFSLLLVGIVPSLWVQPALAQTLSDIERRIVAYAEDHQEEAVLLLEEVVNINSGTMNHDGVREVGRVFEREYEALGFETTWYALPEDVNRAGHLFAETKGASGKRFLLIGHLDTVFERDSPFQRFERHDTLATGPGINDMKGGDVVMLFALKALADA